MKIITQLQQLGVFLGGVVTQHYAGKLLDRQENLTDTMQQNIIYNKLESILNGVDSLRSNMETVLNRSKEINPVQNVSEEAGKEFTAKINETMEYGARLQEGLNNSNLSDQNKVSLSENLSKIINNTEYLKNQIES
jgi:hypothetical protein